MLYLNNKGWGLGMFIAYIAIFFIALIMIVSVANNIDLKSTENNATNSSVQTDRIKYINYERVIKDAASIYANNRLVNISNGDIFYINIDNLDINEDIKNVCDGYAKISKNNDDVYYSPYIKCSGYITSGYNHSVLE